MAPLKQKGDRAEIEVARDLIRRSFRIAIPYGEDWDFDLIFARPGSEKLEPAKNCQYVGIRFAEDYLAPVLQGQTALEVEPAGFEPATFRMQTERSTN